MTKIPVKVLYEVATLTEKMAKLIREIAAREGDADGNIEVSDEEALGIDALIEQAEDLIRHA